MMKVYKIEICAYDLNNIGEDDIRNNLEGFRELMVDVKAVDSRSVEWSDDHPLNQRDTCDQAYIDLFNN